jgi:hypothetical protein
MLCSPVSTSDNKQTAVLLAQHESSTTATRCRSYPHHVRFLTFSRQQSLDFLIDRIVFA